MFEALVGVVIGGLIGIAGTVTGVCMEYQKWKKDRRADYLRSERARLEKLYTEISNRLPDNIVDGKYNIDLGTDILFRCPVDVSQAYRELIQEKDKTPETLRHHLFRIFAAMKQSLADIDRKIEEIF